jgi:lambda family phage minor tail protein L
MDKNTASQSIKKLYAEASLLEPSALLTLFEINIADIGFSQGVVSQTDINQETNTVFRFHNNVKLTNSSIYWQGKEFVAAPIQAEGFETNLKGTLPTPRLSLTVSDEGIPVLSQLKERIRELGDLSGAKVTRIRTFAKFIDAENFYGTTSPAGFQPDPNAEFPRDVFYIDRKSKEDKFTIEYELGSILDVGDAKLPARLVVANSCPFSYRGAGCCYEYSERRIENEHGAEGESVLPTSAPPVANENDEKFSVLLSGITLVDRGAYNQTIPYNSGDFVYITHNNLNYYFVANGVNVLTPPPNKNYWIQEACSKKIKGCELRYALGGSAKGVTLGNLPYGGFSSVTRFK